jgi:hypothetical protein
MGKGWTGQIIIDQGGYDPNLGQAHPDRQIFHAIGHKQGNAIAAHQVLGLGPMRKAVGQVIQFAIGQGLTLKPYGLAVTILVYGPFKIVTDQV